MYTSHHACWDAKNRYGLKDELDFDYREIAHLLRENIVKDSNNVIEKEKVVTTTTTAQEQDNAKKSETSKPQESTNSTKYRPIPDTITPITVRRKLSWQCVTWRLLPMQPVFQEMKSNILWSSADIFRKIHQFPTTVKNLFAGC